VANLFQRLFGTKAAEDPFSVFLAPNAAAINSARQSACTRRSSSSAAAR
jgi:hypothetical protein